MIYIIVWGLFNVNTGVIQGPYIDLPPRQYTAIECGKALMDKGVQKPDKNGNVKLYECIVPGDRPTAQFTN